jgi:hypothetical protein
MLWYKAFLDTRGRFVIGLVLLPCAAIFMVLTYPQVAALLPTAFQTWVIPSGGGVVCNMMATRSGKSRARL